MSILRKFENTALEDAPALLFGRTKHGKLCLANYSLAEPRMVNSVFRVMVNSAFRVINKENETNNFTLDLCFLAKIST